MSIDLNHTIVHARDPHKSATFLSELLGRSAPVRFGPFWDVELDIPEWTEPDRGRTAQQLAEERCRLVRVAGMNDRVVEVNRHRVAPCAESLPS